MKSLRVLLLSLSLCLWIPVSGQGQKGAKNPATFTVTTAAAQIVSASGRRWSVTITNDPASAQNIYLGPDNTVTSSNAGIVLQPGQSLTDSSTSDAWYAVTSTGTATARVMDAR
jgi:hypothetical protein